MAKAFYPGTLDPFTHGHLDIIERAKMCFGSVVIGVSQGDGKNPLFTYKERIGFAREAIKSLENVDVVSFTGLTVKAAKEAGCNVIIRGLRVISDYEYEMQLALMNKTLDKELETVFLMSSYKYIFVSSSVVKEIASFGADVSRFVSKEVEKALREKFPQPRGGVGACE